MTAKFDAIGLVVADLKLTIAFYQRLGLDFGDTIMLKPTSAEACG